MDRVEVTFIKHFANSNRKKGLYALKPKTRKQKHAVSASLGTIAVLIASFFVHFRYFINLYIYSLRKFMKLGFFVGFTAALVLALILIIRSRAIIEKDGSKQYMETLFPLYR